MIRRILSAEREDGYLVVDQYLRSLLPARALRSAFDSGLIDRLAQDGTVSTSQLADRTSLDPMAVELVLAALTSAQVVASPTAAPNQWSLTDGFRRALRYRDLLEAKLDFALLVVPDLADRFDDLLVDRASFLQHSRLMQLFAYDRCFEATRENLEHTQKWMRITTALTRYESHACLNRFPFEEHRHQLDVGGNSGEFVLQACRRFPDLTATVMDLPLVCAIGERHVSRDLNADRIVFRAGNALCDDLPEDVDLISFKSMLHDWPADMARQMLERSVAALPPGGRILIYERAPIESQTLTSDFHLLPMLLFFRSFRSPDLYADWLQQLNCDVRIETVELELPFFVLTAQKQ